MCDQIHALARYTKRDTPEGPDVIIIDVEHSRTNTQTVAFIVDVMEGDTFKGWIPVLKMEIIEFSKTYDKVY